MGILAHSGASTSEVLLAALNVVQVVALGYLGQRQASLRRVVKNGSSEAASAPPAYDPPS